MVQGANQLLHLTQKIYYKLDKCNVEWNPTGKLHTTAFKAFEYDRIKEAPFAVQLDRLLKQFDNIRYYLSLCISGYAIHQCTP